VAKHIVPPCTECGHKGISPKHMSANLMRKDREKILNTLKWYKCVDITIGNKTVVVDFKDWFDKQMERGSLGLSIEDPVIVEYKAT